MKQIINFLWMDSELGDIELLSLQSFMLKGYNCYLWSWGEIKNIPEGVIVKDASEILLIDNSIQKAKFSDLFRYKLLYKYGGIWSDLDNICLKPIPDVEYIFAPYMGFINNNLLKTPKGSKLMLDIVTGIENGNIIFNSPDYNLLYLIENINKLGLMKFALPEDAINPIKHNAGITLALEIQDWSTFDSIVVHLFKSSHRVCVVNSEIYKQNIINLKKFIKFI